MGARVIAGRSGTEPFVTPQTLAAVGFVVLVLVSVTSIWLVVRERSDARVIATVIDNSERSAIRELEVLLQQTKSSQLRYLISGDRAALDAFNANAATAASVLAQIEEPGVDRRESALTRTIAESVHEAIDAMREAADAKQNGDVDGDAFALQAEDQASTLLQRIHVTADEIDAEELRNLRTRSEESRRLNNVLLAFTLAGAALVILLSIASIRMAHRQTTELRKAHRELEEINASLEGLVLARTAELREANEEVQRFAYIVSHDLRSPLVNIMGFSSELEILSGDVFGRLSSLRRESGDVADDDALRSEFEEALRFVKTSTARMDRLIKAVLKLSREGRRELVPADIDMSELVRSVADAFAHRAGELGASIQIESLPPLVSDRLALEQVFSNLIDNALKYLRDDEPGRIVISGRIEADNVIYEVSDNGRGIASNDLERVFELFRRSGPQDVAGEGIGLTHVRTLVRRLGGDIDVRSALGEGSTFTITLPRAFAGNRT